MTEHRHPPLSLSELEALTIFPLPRTVLLPQEKLPLHIFEPRYRAMMEHVIRYDLPLGIALLRPGYEANYYAAPEIYSTLGVGRLVHHEKLPDGRYNIIVQGLARAKITRELSLHQPWRTVCAETLSDVPADQAALGLEVHTTRSFLLELNRAYPRLARLVSRALQKLQDPGALADSLLASLVTEPAQKMKMLAESDVLQRLALVNDRLAAQLLHSTNRNSLAH